MDSRLPATTAASGGAILDRAVMVLRDLGLAPSTPAGDQPVVRLLARIEGVDPVRVGTIARTLSQQSWFNEVVRGHIAEMTVGERFGPIAGDFDSVIDDLKMLTDQLADGRIDLSERIALMVMKVTRGDISDRFDRISATYKAVMKDAAAQVERERAIIAAYGDFRVALKEAEIAAIEVANKAHDALSAAGDDVKSASAALEAHTGDDAAAKARLEMDRDGRLSAFQAADETYQIAKDLADNLAIGVNTADVVMARARQATDVKDRVYKQGVSFFATNEIVLTGLKVSFTGLKGLNEATQSIEAMKAGVSKGLEALAGTGDRILEQGLRTGYGATTKADSVRKLVDSIVGFQERQASIIAEERELSTRNSAEIREAVEAGRRRFAALAARAS
ncbi:cell surface protein [Methylobacterium radiotolerans]|uniref:cell surface protein n=1 Tax=Methylobacterium radiotolerans TaxID=31998 RepID=UPI0038D0D03F